MKQCSLGFQFTSVAESLCSFRFHKSFQRSGQFEETQKGAGSLALLFSQVSDFLPLG